MNRARSIVCLLAVLLSATQAFAQIASADQATVKAFRQAEQTRKYFDGAYGYAVFPSIGKGGIGIGAAHGKGRVYERGKLIGEATMNQVSAGAQLGGQVFSEIIFFQDQRALREFASGDFEFGAGASAVAITAGAGAEAGTGGAGATASAGRSDAALAGGYYKGMATFTVAKGGLMYSATLSGQKFKFKPAK
jgi:lipid-binding SYLF domain-containing protein